MTVLEVFALLGGVGLFLLGMNLMSSGLRNAAGDNLRKILEKATKNKMTSVGVGLGATVLVQSSSATDLMVIGFVSSGLMTLDQAIGVIMGANIGTTITAQITAFDIGAFAPIILFLGVVMYIFFKKKLVKNIGSVIMGFGLLFMGISFMKSTIAPLAELEGFKNFVSGMSNPALTILFGILFTALLQSSSSSTVIFQAFAVQGLITYNTAVYLIIGAAIGAVAPNLLAGLAANRNGKRCSILNLIFNILRAAVILVIISVFPQVLDFIQALSPGDIGRQVANTHTIFAVTAVLILLPFSKYIVKLSELVLPKTKAESQMDEERRLVYMIQTDKIPAALAIDQAHREISRLGHIATDNLALATECFFTLDEKRKDEVYEKEQTVDYLTGAIIAKMMELRTVEMSRREINRVYSMIQVVDDLERISDHAENIAEYEELIRTGQASISQSGLEELQELAEMSVKSLKLCLDIFENERFELLHDAEELEEKVDDLQEEIVAKHVERLLKEDCDPQGGVIFTDMAIDLERCSDHAINIATALAPEEH